MTVQYKFNNIDFKTYGVYVSDSNGIIGKPPRKKPNIFEFAGESGNIPDLKDIRYDVRTITLTCFIKAASATALIDNFTSFRNAISDQTDTKTLSITVGTKSLSYDVYIDEISDLTKKFMDGTNFGTFTIKFIEPDTSIYE